MKRDIDYVVKDNEIIIVDEFTGRLMLGRRYSEGLHQAIEAKEHVVVQKENKTLATITFQNYFRLYGKLSGMTGTAMTEEEEFAAIYNLDISDSARGSLLVDALEKRTYDDRDLPDAVKTVMEHEDVRRAFEFAKAVLVPGKVENMTDDELFTVLQDVCARLNDAIDEVLPEEKRINMDPEARLVIRDILNTVFIDFCGDTLLAAAARLAAAGRIESIDSAGAAINQRYSWEFMSASTGYNEQLQKVPVDHAAAEAANKKAVAATVGRRMLMAIANALNDEWLQADDASALRRHVATQEQKDRADAAVKRAPALLDRYSAGMDACQRAALKAYLITLDLRDEALEASEAALRAKAEEIRPAAINLK